MKAVILAAGKGTRLKPFTYTKPKPLIPVAGKPFLWFLINNLKKAGFEDKDIGVVVGNNKEQVEDFLRINNINAKTIEQKEQLGTAHAVQQAKEFVENDEFVVMMGDNLYSAEDIAEISKQKEICVLGAEHEKPEQFGTLVIEEGYLKGIREKQKPEGTGQIFVNAGLYKFTSKVFDFLNKVEKSERGEFELTDTVSALAKEGPVLVHKAKGHWRDLTYSWHALKVNEFLLKQMDEKREGKISDRATINGKVVIEEGAEVLSNVHIEGPVYISKGCKIGPNCYLRAGTFLAENVHIGNGCEIKNSIVMKNTKIPHLSYIGDSVIGENCNLGAGTNIANLRFDDQHVHVGVKNERVSSGRRKLGCFIGDNVKTGINCSIMPGIVIKENSIIPPHTLINRDVIE
jgi:bifunctional UDP-N-acetylglucosamine pyrophosphorylase/glucosamine-1-phosphate N-acetyltransferase